MVTGHRFAAHEAFAVGITAEVAAEEEVLDRAVALAAGLAGKPRYGVGAIKRAMYAGVIETLAPSESADG
jgi:enoyl-CoA hydratase/carnithine racemase